MFVGGKADLFNLQKKKWIAEKDIRNIHTTGVDNLLQISVW